MPSTVTRPESGRYSPRTRSIKVDLPAPDRPVTTVTAWAGISNVASRRTGCGAWENVTQSNRIRRSTRGRRVAPVGLFGDAPRGRRHLLGVPEPGAGDDQILIGRLKADQAGDRPREQHAQRDQRRESQVAGADKEHGARRERDDGDGLDDLRNHMPQELDALETRLQSGDLVPQHLQERPLLRHRLDRFHRGDRVHQQGSDGRLASSLLATRLRAPADHRAEQDGGRRRERDRAERDLP